jgi:hypothetical protein
MPYSKSCVVSLLIVSSLIAFGKDKKNVVLPTYVLQAQTVLVVVDPDAGIVAEAPLANPTARNDVEKALMRWGRFRLVPNGTDADLIITVRKGHGKIAQTTIGGVPAINRPDIYPPADNRIPDAENPNPTIAGDPSNPPRSPQGPHPQEEIGPSQDMFVIYRGGHDNPLDSPAVWRYSAKDALRSPDVPAVEEFKKVITEAEKQEAAKP